MDEPSVGRGPSGALSPNDLGLCGDASGCSVGFDPRDC
jgi:hypothetical protein